MKTNSINVYFNFVTLNAQQATKQVLSAVVMFGWKPGTDTQGTTKW
jgi:hypothetical protein